MGQDRRVWRYVVHQAVMIIAELHRVDTPGGPWTVLESKTLLLDLLELELLALQTAQVVLLIFQMVGLLVCMQVGLLVEAFVAAGVRAREWLLSCVNAKMSLEIEVKAEPFPTQVALVGLLTSVDEHVSLELRIV